VSLPAGTSGLLDAATAGYRRAGRFAWQFARGKLAGDPAFAGILRLGLLHGRSHLLDLGCGQGLLAMWLLAARACHESKRAGAWPPDWPAPPRFTAYTGIEVNASEVQRAQAAFAAHPDVQLTVTQGDIRKLAFPAVDAVVILDVLHYFDYAAQEDVLRRVRAALSPGGLLLLRIGDAAGGFGFTLSVVTDRIVALFRRGRWLTLHCRTLSDWRALLERSGFSTTAIPMSEGTPFTNTLLRAQAR
jgi:SAM-dependent methyltransferase